MHDTANYVLFKYNFITGNAHVMENGVERIVTPEQDHAESMERMWKLGEKLGRDREEAFLEAFGEICR